MYIIDQYLSLQPVLRRELQLVGVSAMLIASKYEEIWAPEVHRKLLLLLFGADILVLLNCLCTFRSMTSF
jgi:hypothetical protein